MNKLWFVDLPNTEERLEILKMQIRLRNGDPKKFKGLEQVAKNTEGFTGAELEDVIKKAMLTALYSKSREFTIKDIAFATDSIIPLVKTKSKVD